VPSPREIALFLHALRLARRAQDVGRIPLPRLVTVLPRLSGLPRHVDADDALRATLRAVSRGERWFGWLGTCLVKALVLSALVADRQDVELVLGVRRGTGGAPVDGHAWVRVEGREISLLGSQEAEGEGYVTMTTFPVRVETGRRPRLGI
jgi:hypothetical protein